MCINTSKLNPCQLIYSTVRRQRLSSKGFNIRAHRLYRKRRAGKEGRDKARGVGVMKEREMEIKNLKLFMENQSIIEENEKLRKKALQLHQENKALLSQLQELIPSYK